MRICSFLTRVLCVGRVRSLSDRLSLQQYSNGIDWWQRADYSAERICLKPLEMNLQLQLLDLTAEILRLLLGWSVEVILKKLS